MESRDSEQAERTGEERTPNFRIRLTWLKVGAIVLLFGGIDSILPHLIHFLRPRLLHLFLGDHLYPSRARGLGSPEAWAQYLAMILRILHPYAVLAASVLLYYPVARFRGPRERRRARGEIFSGVLNIQILLLMVASVAILPTAERVDPLFLGLYLLIWVMTTAGWCLVGFHLCEGRILTPLGGILIAALITQGAGIFAGTGRIFARAFLGTDLIGAVIFLGWQMAALLRIRGGFDLCPTGLWPAVKRTGLVLVPVALCFWLLPLYFWDFVEYVYIAIFKPAAHQTFPPGHLAIGATMEVSLIAYMAPVVFLLWRGEGSDARICRWILILSVGCILCQAMPQPLMELTLPLVSVGPDGGWGWRNSPYHIAGILLLTIWFTFLPLCWYRWWVWGRFRRPLLATLAAVGVRWLPEFLTGVNIPRRSGFLLEIAAFVIIALALYFPDPVPRRRIVSPEADSGELATES